MPNPSTSKRRSRRLETIPSAEVPADDTPSESATLAAPLDSEAPIARLTMPVTTDGRIDVARLREKTKSALRVALSDPGLSVALGTPALNVSAGEVAPSDAALISQITDSLFAGVSALSVALALRSGYSREHAAILVWDASEKKMVEHSTARVVNKYLPMLEGRYRDEILLGFQVINIIGAKIMLLRHVAAGGTVAPVQPEAQAS